MKNLLVIFVLLYFSYLAAAYLENVPQNLRDPDGEAVACYASGDEFYNRFHDENDYTIVQGSDGYHYYGVREGEEVVASAFRVNKTDPEQAGLTPRALISERLQEAKRTELTGNIRTWPSVAPPTGIRDAIVIYIRFQGQDEILIPRDYYEERFNSTTGPSVKTYFQEVSYNQLHVTHHHYPINGAEAQLSYEAEHPFEYYMPISDSNPIGYVVGTSQQWARAHMLFKNAILAVRSQIPASLNIDHDNDGYIDNITFILKGNAQGGTWFWPRLAWEDFYRNTTINGKLLWHFTLQPAGASATRILCHEFMHTIGNDQNIFVPDFYTLYGHIPVGDWDLMATGFVHMNAWIKYKYTSNTWISDIPEITQSGTYTLNPLTSSTNNAFKIASPYSDSQFFILEYRRKTGMFESNLPGAGLLVYRIIPTDRGNNSPNTLEAYIYRPGGTVFISPSCNGNIAQAGFSGQTGRTQISDYLTNPVSFLRNGSQGGLCIYDVGTAGETITFKVRMELTPPAPVLTYPMNNSVLEIGGVCTLNWNYVPRAESYSLFLYRQNPYYVYEEVHSLTDTQFTIPGNLEQSTTYYWYVVSQNPHGTSTSPTWSFTTSSGLPTAPGSPLTPQDGNQTVFLQDCTFSWEESPNVIMYNFFLYRLNPYQLVTNITGLTEPYYQHTDDLEPLTNYVWFVEAGNAYGSNFSPNWYFRTIDGPDQDEIWMQNGTFTVSDGQYFFDSMGPFGQYTNYEDFLLKAKFESIGKKVSCRFLNVDIAEEGDYLKVYNGALERPEELLMTITGNTGVPFTLSSTHQSGNLTFRFHSNSATRGDGWSAMFYESGVPQLSATSGDRYAILNWTCPGNPDGYNVYRNGTLLNPIPLTETSYHDYYLLNGTNYVYFVKAVYFGQESEASNPKSLTPTQRTELNIGRMEGHTNIPINMNYSAYISQTIYPDELLTRTGLITAIRFHCVQNISFSNRHVKVWLGAAGDLDIENEQWVSPDHYSLVFDGNISKSANIPHMSIPLQMPYQYNGGHLAIKVYYPFDASNPPLDFSYWGTTRLWGVNQRNLAWGTGSNSNDINPDYPPTAFISSSISPNIILGMTVEDEHTFDAGTADLLNDRIPLRMGTRSSITETIYPASIFRFEGDITEIRYYSNFVSDLQDKTVRIWMGETQQTTLENGWISANQLQQVYNGTVNFPAGSNTISIPLQNIYRYQGGNLVVMVYRPTDTTSYSSDDVFYSHSTGVDYTTRLSYSNLSIPPYSPTNPSGSGRTDQIPYTTFVLKLANEWQATVGDGVTLLNNFPLAMGYLNSISQTIYLASEIDSPQFNLVTSLGYYASFNENLYNKPVKIWMGETASTDLYSNWIPASQLNLVFDGTVDFPIGDSMINIYLHEPYNYSGQNLVVMVQRADSDYYTIHNRFKCTYRSSPFRTRYNFSSSTIDPDNPGTGDYDYYTPNISLIFSTFLPELPYPPTNLTAQNLPSSVSLNWEPAYGSREFSGYRLYRNFIPLTDSLLTLTSYIDYEVSDGLSYSYHVSALYGEVESTPSNSVVAGLYPLVTINKSKIDKSLAVNRYASETFQIANEGFGIMHFVAAYPDNEQDEPTDWISVNPNEGSVPTGQSAILNISLNSVNLPPGEYKRVISINTNDPITPQKQIVLMFSVLDGEIVLNWGNGETQMSNQPVQMSYKNSLAQTFYKAEEIGHQGKLTGVYYYNNFVHNLMNKQVKVWVGETEYPNLSNGWIPASQLMLAYDGMIDFPVGVNKILIPFQQPYDYSGANLVVMVERTMDQASYFGFNNFYSTYGFDGSTSARARTVNSSSIALDPFNPTGGSLSSFPVNIGLKFELPIPQNLVCSSGLGLALITWDDLISGGGFRSEPDRRFIPRDPVTLTLLGYNVYKDGVLVTPVPLQTTVYYDGDFLIGVDYEYYVTAVYADRESKPSNRVISNIAPLVSVNFWGFQETMHLNQTLTYEYPLLSNTGLADLQYSISIVNRSSRNGVNDSVLGLNATYGNKTASRNENWLTITPTSGYLQPEEELFFQFEYNTIGLEEGAYEKMIIINTNDPLHPVMQVPVWLYAGIAQTQEITFGSDELTDYRFPINFNARNSLSQSLYLESEIPFYGSIREISFYNYFNTDLLGKPVKIWIGETEVDDLSSGWLPSSIMTLVFDGLVDFPAGQNRIDVPLQTFYHYDGNSNLVVMVQRPYEIPTYSSMNVFYHSIYSGGPLTRYVSSGAVLDPANPSGGILTTIRPNTRILLSLDWQLPSNPPGNLEIVTDNTRVSLSWDASEGATGYKVESSDNPYGEFSDVTHQGSFDSLGQRVFWEQSSLGNVKFFRVRALFP
jgi:M6 family metalloprotease-like protein